MEKTAAELEKIKHSNLLNKVLTHKIYRKRMQVVGIEVDEIAQGTNKFQVLCKLKGDLGDITETLDYVMSNYTTEKAR